MFFGNRFNVRVSLNFVGKSGKPVRERVKKPAFFSRIGEIVFRLKRVGLKKEGILSVFNDFIDNFFMNNIKN